MIFWDTTYRNVNWKMLKGVALLHSIARLHSANVTTEILNNMKQEVLNHPYSSSDLSACDWTIQG